MLVFHHKFVSLPMFISVSLAASQPKPISCQEISQPWASPRCQSLPNGVTSIHHGCCLDWCKVHLKQCVSQETICKGCVAKLKQWQDGSLKKIGLCPDPGNLCMWPDLGEGTFAEDWEDCKSQKQLSIAQRHRRRCTGKYPEKMKVEVAMQPQAKEHQKLQEAGKRRNSFSLCILKNTGLLSA